MLQAASSEKSFDLDVVEIATIWRGGCIIRAAMLDDIVKIYSSNRELSNILLADEFRQAVRNEQALLKATVKFAVSADIPCMGFASALNYLKSYASANLPANLIQAQRDYFGAHTYQRIDKDGIFHTPDWAPESSAP
jgi:6-phosphogluconate dehydrogenase